VTVGDVALLLGGIASVVTALGGAVAAVIIALRTSRRERNDAAKEVAAELLDADLSTEELREIRRALRSGRHRMEVDEP
jgi:divalent metal cation (Fe/Co/Zn/Cd) transporter